MRNLLILNIQAHDSKHRIASALSTHTTHMLFRLRVFATNILVKDGLGPFLLAQTEITTYIYDTKIVRWQGAHPESDEVPPASEGFLPKLQSITHLPQELLSFTRGRSVENITTSIDRAIQIDHLASAIERSATGVANLDITIKPNTLTALLLDRLSAINRADTQLSEDDNSSELSCPVETIILTGADPPHGYIVEFITDVAIQDILSPFSRSQGSGFPNLRTIYWRGNLGSLVRRPPTLYAGSSLEQVWGDAWNAKTVSREFLRHVCGGDGEWRLEGNQPAPQKPLYKPLHLIQEVG